MTDKSVTAGLANHNRSQPQLNDEAKRRVCSAALMGFVFSKTDEEKGKQLRTVFGRS